MLHEFKTSFGSDNHSGVHPKILQALIELNHSHCPSYGADPVTQHMEGLFKQIFNNKNLQAHLVFNGTAANTLSLKSLVQSHHSVLCAQGSHLNMDECGAPEFIIGCKLIALPTYKGKIRAKNIEDHLVRLGDQHSSQPKAVSITQPTEVGTLYDLEELQEISYVCKKNNLFLHIDGARYIYAAHSLGGFAESLQDVKVDALSFGGTKNGLLFGEAVLLFNQQAQKSFKFIRKQCLQLPSKSRFISGGFIRLLDKNLWKEIASQSHNTALYLAQQLESCPSVQVTELVQANGVFAKIPKKWHKHLKDHFFFYVWDEKEWIVRWMMSFDVTKEQIDHFIKKIKTLEES